MAEKHLPIKTALVVLGAGTMIQFLYGIFAGIHDDWMRMSLGLFAGVFQVFIFTMSCYIIFLKRRLGRLETRFHIDPPAPSRRARHIHAVVAIFMVFSIAVYMSFSCWAGFRGEWFRMGLHLSACAITVIVCMGVLTVLVTGSRLSHLERHIADTAAKSPEP